MKRTSFGSMAKQASLSDTSSRYAASMSAMLITGESDTNVATHSSSKFGRGFVPISVTLEKKACFSSSDMLIISTVNTGFVVFAVTHPQPSRRTRCRDR